MKIRFDSKPKEEGEFSLNFFTELGYWVTHHGLLIKEQKYRTNAFAIVWMILSEIGKTLVLFTYSF